MTGRKHKCVRVGRELSPQERVLVGLESDLKKQDPNGAMGARTKERGGMNPFFFRGVSSNFLNPGATETNAAIRQGSMSSLGGAKFDWEIQKNKGRGEKRLLGGWEDSLP